ncbi:MAG: hypothetical protein IJ012_05925 [Clostridia bacterium]|nr:hypothetical protein [Clostridia bacterium]
MKLYLSTIGIAMLVISALNIAFGVGSFYYVVIAVLWCTVLQVALDGLIAILINKLPDRWFGVDNPLYRVTAPERELYKALRVRRWKDKVWELGWLGGFSKKALAAPNDPKYVEKFIIECNKGVLTHRLSYPIGFLAMLTLSHPLSFTIALPVAVVNVYLSVLPTIVLRHNTPMLLAVLRRLQKKTKAAPACENFDQEALAISE